MMVFIGITNLKSSAAARVCVPSLHVDVQLPLHIGNEFLDVLMATVGEGYARALSVGRQRCGGDDSFRVYDDELIVQLRELYEWHERPCLLVRAQNLRRAGTEMLALPFSAALT